MAAVRNLHLESGFSYPDGPASLLARVMRGVSRSASSQRARLPVTAPLLRKLCHRLDQMALRPRHDRQMLITAFTVAFHCFLRCGELTSGLTRSDVTIDPAGRFISLRLASSKTDPNGRGTTITAGASPDEQICPVRAMSAYLTERVDSAPHLFVYRNGTLLTRERVTAELRTLLPACGVTQPAPIAGVPEHLIRHMGRWRSDSVLRYIRVGPDEQRTVSGHLATVL